MPFKKLSRRTFLTASSALAFLHTPFARALPARQSVNINDYNPHDWIASFKQAFSEGQTVVVPAGLVCDNINTGIFIPAGKTLHILGSLRGNGRGRFVLQDGSQVTGEKGGSMHNITLDVRGSDCTIKGLTMSGFGPVTQIYIGGKNKRVMRNLTIDNLTVSHANYAILRQGFHNQIIGANITNCKFSDLQGDAIEWNVAINDRDILIISTPQDTPRFQQLLGDGSQWGLNLQYKVQLSPDGLAQAFIIGEEFIGGDDCALVLGDNIFYGHDLPKLMDAAVNKESGATVFAYHVNDPERYGVVEFDKNGTAISLEEKPLQPKSNYAVTGLYFYDNDVVEMAKNLQPSARGELEITDINRIYMEQGRLSVAMMGRGYAWLDTGTHQSLIEASNFIATIEERQGLKVSCPEEIAYRKGFIDAEQVKVLAEPLKKNAYGQYLLKMIKGY